MDHEIAGVAFRVSGMRAPFTGREGDARVANGCELTRACDFRALASLVGHDVPGLGPIIAFSARRTADPVQSGMPFNLVTAAATP